jgi:hypothetical protein
MADRNALREQARAVAEARLKDARENAAANAAAKRKDAEQKIAAAKRDAAQRKVLKENPLPTYVEMPELTGDAEADSKADLDSLMTGFRKRAADESTRFALAVDGGYWAALCFQTREQKDAFLRALNIQDLGNAECYFDGCAVAKRLGIALPDADVPYNTGGKLDPTWVSFTK